jgi:hypothetical protein
MKRWGKTHKKIIRLNDIYRQLVRQSDEYHRELAGYTSPGLQKLIRDNWSHQKQVLVDMRMLTVKATLDKLTATY